jgi:hypothetical protein
MGFLMQILPLGREFVLGPDLLQMDQRALPRTIQPVLERGKREKLVFGVHSGS